MQQQQTGAKPQSGLTWVYNDLPEKKLKVLAIIQVVIGSIYIALNILSFLSGHQATGLYLGIVIAGSGGAALWTLQRKDKMLVTGTGLLALIAAVLIGILVVFSIIFFIMVIIGLAANSGQQSQYGSGITVLAIVILAINLAVQLLELIVCILLAVTAKRILDHSQPVAPTGAPLVVGYTQA